MRTLLAIGAAVLALVGSMDSAEARARIRMSFGRTLTPQRPVMPAPVIAAPVQTGSVGRAGYRLGIVVTPVQAAVTAAADAEGNAEPRPKPQQVAAVPAPAWPRIQDLRTIAPSCEAGKRVGGIERKDAGFCLIN